MDLLKAEKHLKRSLELDASQEELDFFNGKLTRAEIKKLVVRLKVLQRNIELKGKDLGNEMCEPTLLDVLKKKVQKLLMRLKAHGRARRPQEKKRGARPKKSTWMLPNPNMAELCKENDVKGKLQVNQFVGGRITLLKSHQKKFFKENFKPP